MRDTATTPRPKCSEPTLYQIWLIPERQGLTPSYEQKSFPATGRHNEFRLVAAPGAAEGALAIRQDARIYLAQLDPGAEVTHPIPPDRHAWLQVLRGNVTLGDHSLTAGDGAALSNEAALTIQAQSDAEVMLFDLA